MNDLKGKIAVVTGASIGVGEQISLRLVKAGVQVIGCARSEERLKSTADRINEQGPGNMHAFVCDITKEDQVRALFAFVKEKFGKVHICVNNAGIAHAAPLLSGDFKEWRTMYEVNVLGLSMCTQEACKLMEQSGINDGHVVMLNSVAGHNVLNLAVFYSSTKFAVTCLAEGLRQELRAKKSKTRVTSISPDAIKTPFLTNLLKTEENVKKVTDERGWLKAEHVADTVMYALQCPLQMDVHDVIIRPNC